uniref:Secreted protein n=1 Tax=Solanum tuberosum TaxID=4113 RepID=M1DPU6_SOLTU
MARQVGRGSWPVLLVLGTSIYGPLHGPCEGPRTVKASVDLHLGFISARSRRRTHSRPVIGTTAHGGLRGSTLEPWWLCITSTRHSTARMGIHDLWGALWFTTLAGCEPRVGRWTVVPFTVCEPLYGSPTFLMFNLFGF